MENQPLPPQVTVTDIRMPFGSMVVFMVKWAIASIPALTILAVLVGFCGALLLGFFGTIGNMRNRVTTSAAPGETAWYEGGSGPFPGRETSGAGAIQAHRLATSQFVRDHTECFTPKLGELSVRLRIG